MYFLTFFGRYRGHEHPHESSAWMTVPLIILAIPTVLVGFWGSNFLYGFQRLLEGSSFQAEPVNYTLDITSALLAIVGIIFAWIMYGTPSTLPQRLGAVLDGRPYTILLHRYYIDELYMRLIDVFAIGTSTALSVFDRPVLDAAWNGVGSFLRQGGESLRRRRPGAYRTTDCCSSEAWR